MKITYNFAIKKNNILEYYKPNEDYIIAENNIFIIADGVTRDLIDNKYPNPSPATETSKILCHIIHSHLKNSLTNKDIRHEMLRAILTANEEIMIYNMNHNYTTFLPGAVLIIGIIINYTLYIAYIGDCSGYLIRDKKITRLSDSQTTLINQHKNEFSKYEIRDIISNNINHPYGYGVLNGEKGIIDFFEYKEIKLKNEDNIILASDGLDVLFSQINEIDFELLSSDQLISIAERLEKAKSDDKAIVSIKVTSDESL